MLDFEKTGFSIGLPENWDFKVNDVDTLALIADSSDSQKLRLSVYSDINVYGNDIESLYIDFSKNFSQFIHQDNVGKLYEIFNRAYADIGMNAYNKIVFLDVALKIVKLIKK